MLLTEPSLSDASIDSSSVADPSKRTFLAKMTALLATATCGGLASPSGEAARRRYPSATRPPAMSALSASIDNYIKYLRLSGRIATNERTAWLVYDFTSRQYLTAINASIPYQSASMIKPFIALAFFYKVLEGKLHYTPYNRMRMEAMIQYSNNSATNHFMRLLNQTSRRSGPVEAERTLKRYHPGIFRNTHIVERIPTSGRTYRNKASALDYHRFLYALWYNQLPFSNELKRLMNLPNRDRVYTGADEVARQTWVFDKTGTTARLCGNMGILVAQGRNGGRYPYTFIGIIEKSRSTKHYRTWKDNRGDVIRDVSGIAYQHLSRMYNLV